MRDLAASAYRGDRQFFEVQELRRLTAGNALRADDLPGGGVVRPPCGGGDLALGGVPLDGFAEIADGVAAVRVDVNALDLPCVRPCRDLRMSPAENLASLGGRNALLAVYLAPVFRVVNAAVLRFLGLAVCLGLCFRKGRRLAHLLFLLVGFKALARDADGLALAVRVNADKRSLLGVCPHDLAFHA